MSKQLATVGNWSIEDVQTMKHTLADGTTDSQFQLFLRTAHASGLNPFLNHIYAITYKGQMSLQIGIEGIAYLAKQKEGFLGYDAQVVYEGEPFKATRNKEGVWEIEHEPDVFQDENAKIKGAYAVAFRDGFKPHTVIMKFSEVEHFQKSPIPNQQTMWKRYTADMFKKHVLKRALKGQFGIDINEDGAFEQSAVPEESYQRKEINSEVTEQKQEQPKPDPKAVKQEPGEDEKQKLQMERMAELFKDLDITTKPQRETYIEDKLGKPLNTKNITALIKILEADVKKKELKAKQSEEPLPFEDDPELDLD